MQNPINKKISVVIPGYNESGNIEEMYQRLTAVLSGRVRDYELIFVDDDSTDGSQEVLRKLADKDHHVVAMFFSRNFGNSQYGFSAGSEYATGDAVVWLDADLQDPPELIEQFIQKWQAGCDVAYGIRTKRKGSLFLRFAYKIFYIIFNKLAFMKVPRDVGDFSLVDRKVVNILNAMPERDRYLRGLRAWAGFRTIGVPYVRDERKEGRTSNNLIKNIKWAKKAIFSFSYAPVEFIFYLAASVFVISLAAIVFYLVSFFWGSPSPRGFTTLLLVSLFLGSVQLLSLSIIAEYIGRIFEEVKGRPKYIVKEVVDYSKRP